MKRFISLFLVVLTLMSILAVPLSASAASKLSLRSTSGTTVSADSSLRLSWSSVSGAKNYKVYVKDLTISKVLVNNKKVTSTSYTISSSSLGYARSLTITVTALDKKGKTLCQETITVKTMGGTGSVTTKSASVSKGGAVKITFKVDTNGGSNITDCGIVYGTSSSRLNNKVSYGSIGSKKGSFTVKTTLHEGTYYYKAYVTNANGTAYGAVKKVVVYGCPWCGTCGSFAQVYAHCLASGCFKQNPYLNWLWETGSTLLTAGLNQAIEDYSAGK